MSEEEVDAVDENAEDDDPTCELVVVDKNALVSMGGISKCYDVTDSHAWNVYGPHKLLFMFLSIGIFCALCMCKFLSTFESFWNCGFDDILCLILSNTSCQIPSNQKLYFIYRFTN